MYYHGLISIVVYADLLEHQAREHTQSFKDRISANVIDDLPDLSSRGRLTEYEWYQLHPDEPEKGPEKSEDIASIDRDSNAQV